MKTQTKRMTKDEAKAAAEYGFHKGYLTVRPQPGDWLPADLSPDIRQAILDREAKAHE